MAESLADQVLRKIADARELYHRLILIVAPAGSGKAHDLNTLIDKHPASQTHRCYYEVLQWILEYTVRTATKSGSRSWNGWSTKRQDKVACFSAAVHVTARYKGEGSQWKHLN